MSIQGSSVPELNFCINYFFGPCGWKNYIDLLNAVSALQRCKSSNANSYSVLDFCRKVTVFSSENFRAGSMISLIITVFARQILS